MEDALSPAGRARRVAATAVFAVLLLAGTVVGGDDHFPFGPFLMYAGVNPPNAPAPDTRVEAVDVTGRLVQLTERNSGVRRAEIEGQQQRYQDHPELLDTVADAYASRNTGAAALAEVRIIIRWHEIRQSRPTGGWHDETVATWRAG